MKMSDLYVIVYWLEWVGISCVGEDVYQNKEDAEKKIEELKSLPSYRQEKYQAITLSRYIQEQCKQAADEVRHPIE